MQSKALLLTCLVRRLLSLPYALAMQLRNFAYECGLLAVTRVSLPVISIGNLGVGGNGKTPLCIHLCQQLRQRGLRPVVLTRGYGGSVRTVHRVAAGDSPANVGDEALLLFMRSGAEVLVCPRRAEGARFAEVQQLGDVLLLDDGLQHRALARDFEIVSVNLSGATAARDFIEGIVLPGGRFRESKQRALKRVQALVFAQRSTAASAEARQSGPVLEPALLQGIPTSVSIHTSSLEFRGLLSLAAFHAGTPPEVCANQPQREREFVAFCGLAQPQGFFETVRTLGVKVRACCPFSDHHPFSAADIAAMQQQYPGCELICSEKDAVKIPVQSAAPIWVLCIELQLLPAQALVDQIVRTVVAKQSQHK